MKQLCALLMILSVGLFLVGCETEEPAPVGNGGAPEQPITPDTEMPADDGAPAEPTPDGADPADPAPADPAPADPTPEEPAPAEPTPPENE